MLDLDCLPYYAQGEVVTGFGRGSKDLKIPTANFHANVVSQLPESLKCGVYFGWASVDGISGVHKMVLSVGWNVFYGNDIKTMETHILHEYDEDFYGENLRVIILGFIRPMCNFDSLDALITAIHNDIRIAEEELTKPKNLVFKTDTHFTPTAPAVAKTQATTSLANGSHTFKDFHKDHDVHQSDESKNSASNGATPNCSRISSSQQSLERTDKSLKLSKGTNGLDITLGNVTQPSDDINGSKDECIQQNSKLQNIEANGRMHSNSNGVDMSKDL